MSGKMPSFPQGGESLLFLTDEQLRKGIEAMFFAYRGFTADPDRILQDYGYGRAHHRAIHFINRTPGTTGKGMGQHDHAPSAVDVGLSAQAAVRAAGRSLAQVVILPAPRQTTTSPSVAMSATSPASSTGSLSG